MSRRFARMFLPTHTNVRNPWLPDPEAPAGGDGGEGGSGGDKGGKEYTPPASQADLDRIVTERLARDRARFADYDELKAAKAKLDKIEADNATDLERAVKAAKDEGKTEALTAANTRVIKAEARALAATAKFRDPADAVAFLDLSSIKVSDNGDPDTEAIKAALATLAEQKKYLLDDGKVKPDPTQGGGNGGGVGNQSSVARGREMYEARRGKKAS